MVVLKSVGDSIAITLTINWLASQSMVLKPGPDYTVRLGKPRTGHFYSLFNMKNCSMQKKNNELYGLWSDCPVLWIVTSSSGSHGSFVSSLKWHHFGLSSLFFFSLYGVVWTLELDYSLKQETLASLSELSTPLSHSNYISHLCLSPSLPSATTDLNPDHSSPHSHLCLSPSSPLATALSFVKLDQVK